MFILFFNILILIFVFMYLWFVFSVILKKEIYFYFVFYWSLLIILGLVLIPVNLLKFFWWSFKKILYLFCLALVWIVDFFFVCWIYILLILDYLVKNV